MSYYNPKSSKPSANASATSRGGLGVLGIIQVFLIVAKFVKVDWNVAYNIPWVWVFTPIYVGTALFVLLFAIVVAAAIWADK